MSHKTRSEHLDSRFPPDSGANRLFPAFFWKILAAAALGFALVSWFFVKIAVEDKREELIFALHARAESLIWAVEGGARFFRGSHGANLSPMLVELGRQPGVAWIAIVDKNGVIIYDSNPNLVGKSLYSPGEMKMLAPGDYLKGRFAPDDPDIYETWRQFNPGGRGGQNLYVFVGLDMTDHSDALNEYSRDRAIWAGLISLAALCILIIVFYAHNYRASRRRLEDARALAAQIMKSFPAALLIVDGRGHVKFYNGLAAKMLRIGAPKKKLSLKDLPYADWNGIFAATKNDEPLIDNETTLLFPDDAQLPVNLSLAPIFDGAGRKTGNLLVLRDLAEINLLKEKVDESRRMSAIGGLAAGLAHEIRNPLGAICGYAHYLSQKTSQDMMARETARLLLDEAERLNRALTDLLYLAKPHKLNLKRQPLDSIAAKTYRLLKADAKAKNIDFMLETAKMAEAPLPAVDADKLAQVLFNLAINAIQAAPERGIVSITVGHARRNTGQSGWNIVVRDNGEGMTEAVRKRIFTPYFTTKASGTGLGLALSKRIVEAHGGSLTAASLPGQGAAFTIFLPDS